MVNCFVSLFETSSKTSVVCLSIIDVLRKISVEQRSLDEREGLMRAGEEKARLRDADAERRLVDLRQRCVLCDLMR